jgi:hypothetical protein
MANLGVSSGTLYDGTQAVTASAVALNSGTSQKCSEVLVQNDPGSAGDILVGNATSQSMRLTPGAAEAIAIDDVAKVFVIRQTAGTAATCNWHARS